MIQFEGAISAKAVLEEGRRQHLTLYIDKSKRTKDFAYILAIAKKAGAAIVPADRQTLDAMTNRKGHGGILLQAGNRDYPDAKTLPDGFLCYVEGVEDPFNLGSVCRTLYSQNCQALILPKRDWSHAEDAILRASAGTWERMTILMDKPEDIAKHLQEKQIPVLCAHRAHAKPLYDFVFPDNFCICIGGAMRGLSRDILDISTQNLYIPYGRDMKMALDTPSATAIFAYAAQESKYENK